ncbi:MAG: DNA polymerase III subunit chi [Rickettsiales bacterium]|nr:DNA polymerase III subunit chi [Pseudomonadota bacterium]MDA0966992.1 DNA polymerase III subunit chi [Pseudomonadota bacterium]MDG4543912.1 DNA polymerase III subunit chi [Rickettsiales bacterium]MDG4546058.1 DNA polymerase III subunit chi [Rickettsiales bacterium]MDG4548304.1 DNA polymerase III subunit chi [Rickettsiales bacterium]
MTMINFYHLTKLPVGKALPKLLEKAIMADKRVMVQLTDDIRVEQLNKEMWTYTTKFFLPHGAKGDGFEDEQPIYLTASNENANGATILAMVENATIDNLNDFEKCIYMFDGNDESQLKAARVHWKEFKSIGHEVTYWQQTPKGGWEAKA